MLVDDSIVDLSVDDLCSLFRTHELSPVDIAESVLDRINRFQDEVNAFVFVDRDQTLIMARESADRYRKAVPLGPLDGIPVSIKDLQPVKGWPMRRGSQALDPNLKMVADSPAVARLREAGTVFVGKTATAESGCRIVTRSAVHGVTRNPYDLSRTPGGSSGGAAAALALGMGTLALGTDGAGSIRIPASFCNLAGMKPSFGRVPSFPPSIFMPHSVIGPMARRVTDVKQMLAVMSTPDQRDPYAWPVPFEPNQLALETLTGMRIGISMTMGTNVSPGQETIDAVNTCVKVLRESGALVEEVEPEWPIDPYEPFIIFWEVTYAGYLSMYSKDEVSLMSELLRGISERGKQINIVDYHRALDQRLQISTTLHALFNRYDAILSPVMPNPAFDVDKEAPDGENPDDWRWCPYTYVFNMTGQPALSVPVSISGNGLPIGVQISGAIGTEEKLFQIGEIIQSVLKTYEYRPNLLKALP